MLGVAAVGGRRWCGVRARMAASCGGGGQGRRTLSGPRAHGASNGFDPRAAQQNPLTPPPFLVEKWDGWDAQKQAGSPMKVLSNSDCEPLFLKELLAMADDEMKSLSSLSYPGRPRSLSLSPSRSLPPSQPPSPPSPSPFPFLPQSITHTHTNTRFNT